MKPALGSGCQLSSSLSRALVPAWLPPAPPMATDSREGKSRITVAETSWGEFPALFPGRHPQRLSAGWQEHLPGAFNHLCVPGTYASGLVLCGHWNRLGGWNWCPWGFPGLAQTHRINGLLHESVAWVGRVELGCPWGFPGLTQTNPQSKQISS